MRWADRCRALVAATLCIVGGTLATAADQSTYGKVDTFEPGKKYNCVPSADHKGWDCAQTGKATNDEAAPAARRNEPAPVVPANPKPATAPAAATAPRTGKLPNYLLAPGASDSSTSTPAPVAAPAPVPAPASPPAPTKAPESVTAPIVYTSTNPQPAPAVVASPPPPKTASPPTSEPAAVPEKPAALPATAPAPPPVPTRAAVAPASPKQPRAPANISNDGGHDFLTLPGDQYVIELAHADSAARIAANRAALQLPRGKVYELHLRQNGGDHWLLVWGSFDDVGAARMARGELPADAHAGWPRRIAPLQAEVRRAQE